jgi:hypothetical protein
MPDDDAERVGAVRGALDDYLNRLARAVVDEMLGPESAAKPRANPDQPMPQTDPKSPQSR